MSEFEETCWWCDEDVSGIRFEDHDCPAKNLSREAQLLVYVLPAATFCDHYCCGMSENMCLASRLAHELVKNGWTAPQRPDPKESPWRD